MKITIFTSNQSRHISLIKRLSDIADTIYAVNECNTVFPGQVKDFFNNSQIMRRYFEKVIQAEKTVFGDITFLPSNVRTMPIKMGDLNKLSISNIKEALNSNYYIVFGSSFIKGELLDFLIKNKAINIHMGVSPYFRGSSCNFWASYMKRYDLVGATIHLLSEGLDSGDILYHALPKAQKIDPFELGMRAVEVAHKSLGDLIKSGKINDYIPLVQDKDKQISYTINSQFDDNVAGDYLQNLANKDELYEILSKRDVSMLINPYID